MPPLLADEYRRCRRRHETAQVRRVGATCGHAAGSGFSLVELMVALGIGAIVLLGLTDLLMNSKTAYLREEQLARLQENGRVAAMVAARQLRANRSMDCRSIAMAMADEGIAWGTPLAVKACDLLDIPAGKHCADADWRAFRHYLSTDRALGYDNSEDLGDAGALSDLPPSARTNIADRWLRGDVLVTWGVDGPGTWLTDSVASDVNDGGIGAAGPIRVAVAGDGLRPGRYALISDCIGADVFEISGPEDLDGGSGDHELDHAQQDDQGDKVNASDALSRVYNWSSADTPAGQARQIPAPVHRANVYPLAYNVYYICCVDIGGGELQSGSGVRHCRSGEPVFNADRYRPSLCTWDMQTARSYPVVNDIADMRVTYTGDRDADGALDFFAQDVDPIPTAAWVTAHHAWAGVRSAAVELLVVSGEAGVATQANTPASADWPPNDGSGQIAADTLGQGLPADSRLHQRFHINVAMRSRAPWYIGP